MTLLQEENPYERILADEIKDQVLKSKMLLIIHKNPMTRHFLRQVKTNSKIVYIPRKV